MNSRLKFLTLMTFSVALFSCATKPLVNPIDNSKYDYDAIEDTSSQEFIQFTTAQNNVVNKLFFDEQARKQYRHLLQLNKATYDYSTPEFMAGNAYRLGKDSNGRTIVESTSSQSFNNDLESAKWVTVLTEAEVQAFFGKEVIITELNIPIDNTKKLRFWATVAGSDNDFYFEWILGRKFDKSDIFYKDTPGITDVVIASDNKVFYLGNKENSNLTARRYSKTLFVWRKNQEPEALFTIPEHAEWPMLFDYKVNGEIHAALNYFENEKVAKMYFSDTGKVSQSTDSYIYKFNQGDVYSRTEINGQKRLVKTTLEELKSNKPKGQINFLTAEDPKVDLDFHSYYITQERAYAYYFKDGVIQIYAYDKDSLKLISSEPAFDSTGYGTVTPYVNEAYPDRLFLDTQSYRDAVSLLYLKDSDSSFTKHYLASANNEIPIDIEFSKFTVKSAGGADVPYIVAHQKGQLYNASTTLLKPYGGFNRTTKPYFLIQNLNFIRKGGKIVYPSLRGGGGKDDDWYLAGKLLNKKNTFADLNAVIEDLHANGITTPQLTHLYGQSNGGLVVMSTIALHNPQIASAVINVPITDMLNYHNIGPGKMFVSEYGSPDNPEHRKYLASYSPVEDVYIGERLPPILIFFSDKDDRVLPEHSIRLFKKLSNMSDRVYIYHNELGGHISSQVEHEYLRNIAIMHSFFYNNEN